MRAGGTGLLCVTAAASRVHARVCHCGAKVSHSHSGFAGVLGADVAHSVLPPTAASVTPMRPVPPAQISL